jgi:hypothetical protein
VPKILAHTKCIDKYCTQIFAATKSSKTHCKNRQNLSQKYNWAELAAKSLKYWRLLKIKILAYTQNICAHLEISAHIQNICLRPKYLLTSKIFAPHLKYLRISKIYAPHLKYLRISKIYAPHLKYLRLIVYDSNKAAVEISVPYEKYMRPENRRPNCYYLGSAGSPTSDFF